MCSEGVRKVSGLRPEGRVAGVDCKCLSRKVFGASFWKVAGGKERGFGGGGGAVVIVFGLLVVGWLLVGWLVGGGGGTRYIPVMAAERR